MPEINELTDVEVETLGLVTRGANREEFFLLKAAGDLTVCAACNKPYATDQMTMVDGKPVCPDCAKAEDEQDEGEVSKTHESALEAATQTIWQRLVANIKKALAEPTFAADNPVEENAAKVSEPEITKQEIIQALPAVDETAVVAPEPEPEVVPEPVAKQEPTPVTNTQTEAFMAENEVIAKADFDALAVRLEKAEAELAKSQGEKERAVWLQKAQTYSYMPVSSTDLAEQLQYLAKAAPTRAEWWMDVLKACDNMVKDSGLFVEKGTTIEAEDAVSKVVKSDNPRDAALNMPRAEAEAYLRDVRRRGQGGR
jgi:hypothetical protein